MNNDPSTSIYSRLLAGEAEDAIAQSFLDELDAAKTRLAEEKERADQEAQAKQADLIALVRNTAAFLRTHYPSLLENHEVDCEAIANVLAGFLDRATGPKPKWNIDPLALPFFFW